MKKPIMKKPVKKQAAAEVSLELNGVVNVVERFPGKRAKRTPIDGHTILHALIMVLGEGLELVEQKLRFQKAIQDGSVLAPLGSNLPSSEATDVPRSRGVPSRAGGDKPRQP